MSQSAVTAISVVIGIFMVFFGTLKLCPIFSEDLYRSTTFPLSTYTGWNPGAHAVRRVHGLTEVVGGLLLAFCPGLMRDVSNAVLLLLMLFNLFAIWLASEGLREASNSVVFCLLLTCRFVIRAQMAQKPDDFSDNDDAIKEDIRRRISQLRHELNQMKVLESEITHSHENQTKENVTSEKSQSLKKTS